MILQPERIFALSQVFAEEYVYISPDSGRPLGGLADCDEHFIPPECPNWPEKHGAPNPSLEGHRFQVRGRAIGDLLWYWDKLFVREAFVPALEAGAFSGIEVARAELYRDANCLIYFPGFVEMRISGRGIIDMERSGVSVKYQCPICGYRSYTHWKRELGLHFVQGFEEIPDVFWLDPEIMLYVFVKSRFGQFLIDQKIRPVMLTPVERLDPWKYDYSEGNE